MTIIGTDGKRAEDEDVLHVYENKDEHLHAESAESGTLPRRLKLACAVDESGLCSLEHTIQLNN